MLKQTKKKMTPEEGQRVQQLEHHVSIYHNNDEENVNQIKAIL